MTPTHQTRSAFRFSPVLWSGLAGVMLLTVNASAAPCTFSAQCELDGACCVNCMPQYACIHVGVQQGTGSCLGDEACCMSDGTCQPGVDGLCCDEEGGVAAGPGTACGVYDCGDRACCVPDPDEGEDYCQDLSLYDCLAANGEPQAAGTTCGGLPNNDGDTIPDVCDNCPFNTNGSQSDVDDDGWGDVCDVCPDDYDPGQENSDTDAWGDLCDNCPFDNNFLQEDCNDDDEGDACDIYDEQDNDEDGICNLPDNCPEDVNPGQENSDTDSHGDACDNCIFDDNEDQADCTVPPDGVGDACEDDCDGDGIPDECDDEPDCDGDGIPDDCDVEPDCDGDGIPDACDNEPDCDDDGIPNDCDPDIDNDGVLNDDDVCDYTPVNQIPPGKSVNAEGTLPGDLDGDCDVDDNDLGILISFTTGSGPCPENDDNNHTDDCCDHCFRRPPPIR